MRKLIILLLSLMPAFATAQTITSEQKQEALNTATQFCNLFTRFCKGERTTVMTQINQLYSGSGISTYDDIKENKETILKFYLSAIQDAYPNSKLNIQLSAPSLNDCEIYYEYDFAMSTTYRQYKVNNTIITGPSPSLSKDNLLNVLVIFNVKEQIPSLGINIMRKLIYSTKSKKITAFVLNNSPSISVAKGLDAFANNDYKQAIYYFEEALRNGGERFADKRDCYIGLFTAYFYLQDIDSEIKYAKLLKDNACVLWCKMIFAGMNGNNEDAFKYAKQMEQELLSGNESMRTIDEAYWMLGNLHGIKYFGDSVNPHYSSSLCVSYLKKCIDMNGVFAGYASWKIYVFKILNQETDYGGISDKTWASKKHCFI